MLALPIGTNIGGYIITGVIGRGGFGITYKGQEANTRQDVAIKEYFPSDIAIRPNSLVQAKSEEVASDFQKGKTDFLYEARALAMCRHTSIVRVIGFFEQFGTAYIVMEFVAGNTLHSIVNTSFKSGMSEAHIKKWLWQILDALEVVHGNGLTHRDVKPENILIRPNGTAVLVDFGAAKQIAARNSALSEITLTHGYAPPEQYTASTKDIGAWSDIYALGATIFFAMSGGTLPPRAMDRVNAVASIPRQEDPLKFMMTRLSEQKKFSKDFLTLVQKMLAISINDRLKTVSEVKSFLASPSPKKNKIVVEQKQSFEEQERVGSADSFILGIIIFLLLVIIVCVALILFK